MQSFQNEVLYPRLTGNMKFVGIYYMVVGVLTSITIIGAIVGVPIFLAGSRLRDAAENLKLYNENKSDETLNRAFNLQNSSFFIYKILIIVGLVIAVLYIIGIIVFLSTYNISHFPRV
jgi:ABC-type multidrug transport system permease subunit